jgi:hypothetical protein
VSIAGDLPLLSLGRKIVVQPRQLLHIAARGGSELEFTSIASTLTGLKVSALRNIICHTSHVTRHTSHVTRRTSHVTRHTSLKVSTLNVSVGGVAVIACE